MRQLLTVKEAAEILEKHPATIRRWIQEKKLSAQKIGGKYGFYLLSKSEVLELKIQDLKKKVKPQGLFR